MIRSFGFAQDDRRKYFHHERNKIRVEDKHDVFSYPSEKDRVEDKSDAFCQPEQSEIESMINLML